jgi:hypothetical protein
MRKILLLLPITLGISPLAAQLTPAQRQAQETKVANEHLSERLQAEWTERALNGDPTAYGGATARQDRRDLNQRLFYGSWLTRVTDDGTVGGTDLWYGFSAHASSLRSLRRDGAALAAVKAGRASVLTVATPVGGPARTLTIRSSIGGSESEASWSHAGPVTADQSGRYLIPVPALSAGTYDVRIAVYDPERPDTPLSESRNSLVVRQ